MSIASKSESAPQMATDCVVSGAPTRFLASIVAAMAYADSGDDVAGLSYACAAYRAAYEMRDPERAAHAVTVAGICEARLKAHENHLHSNRDAL